MEQHQLDDAVKAIAKRDRAVAQALKTVGFPAARRAEPGFASLVRILLGQQLSVKAAATIHERFCALLEGGVTPKAVLGTNHEDLRGAGLSRAKIKYIQSLAQATLDQTLSLATIAGLDEPSAMKALTQVKGIGPWTAQIYLLFCEGRPDVWPSGDLALQEALKRLKGLDVRPTAAETVQLVEPWKPWRGAMAVFLWHYYAASGAPV
ncbi:MAG: DNA-3-methyladenine glycosylase 2 family protein [Pseudomonadota bacterium]